MTQPCFFEMRWPVLDTGMDQQELIQEALADLKHELPELGLLPLSHPVFTFVTSPKLHKHAGPFLVARLAVRDQPKPPTGVTL